MILNEHLGTRILRSMNTCDQILRIFEKRRLVLQKEYVQANTHCNATLVWD